MNKFKKLYPWIFSLALVGFTAYSVLDIFVIPKKGEIIETGNTFSFADAVPSETSVTVAETTAVSETKKSAVSTTVSKPKDKKTTTAAETTATTEATTTAASAAASEAAVQNNDEQNNNEEDINVDLIEEEAKPIEKGSEEDHADEKYTIHVENIQAFDCTIHCVDVKLSHISYLKTGAPNGDFGNNNKDYTSNIAQQVGATFAVNGDFFGSRTEGIVIRNGNLYRDKPSSKRDSFVIWNDGSCDMFIHENSTSGAELAARQAYQVFTFGPGLVRDGEILIDENTEVNGNHIGNKNPRCAIGYYEPNHFLFITTDGRSINNEPGLRLYDLAQILKDKGVKLGYNLDGGGSTTMYYNGGLINIPANNKNDLGERKVSDIIYIGG